MKLTCPLEPAHGELRTVWHLFAHLLQDHNIPQADAARVVTEPLDLRLDGIADERKRRKAETAGPAPPPRTRAPGFYVAFPGTAVARGRFCCRDCAVACLGAAVMDGHTILDGRRRWLIVPTDSPPDL